MRVMIPCGNKKQHSACQAQYMYTGSYFKACLVWALSVAQSEDIYILSGKYGLIPIDMIIDPYEQKILVDKQTILKVKQQAQKYDIIDKPIILIGGKLYVSVGKQVFHNSFAPLVGLKGIGYHMQWLKRHRGQLPNCEETT